MEVKEMIRAQETALMTQAERHLNRMEEEITLLRKKHNDLEKLSHSDDHIHFLQVQGYAQKEYSDHIWVEIDNSLVDNSLTGIYTKNLQHQKILSM